ncbi:unnamed protein product [Lactuca saligna]|uniref:Protein kinase domain-containing protein n=1 Tax=Lactuca saligna TaxID=75948 RepID=A0AA35Y6K8_LACSI|nr:unnamed protein product [Lactuca saligna]
MMRKKKPVHHCGEEIERSRGYRRGRAFTILPAPSRAHNGKKKEAEKLQSDDGEAVVRRVATETGVGDAVGRRRRCYSGIRRLKNGEAMAPLAPLTVHHLSSTKPRNQPDTQLYTKVAGTQIYLDPTYHESRILRKESDVYSFGVVLFEILSGMLVYGERSFGHEQQFLMNNVRRYQQNEPDKLIDPYIRDQINCGSFDTFKEIAYQCISLNLTERPMLDTVIKKI